MHSVWCEYFHMQRNYVLKTTLANIFTIDVCDMHAVYGCGIKWVSVLYWDVWVS